MQRDASHAIATPNRRKNRVTNASPQPSRSHRSAIAGDRRVQRPRVHRIFPCRTGTARNSVNRNEIKSFSQVARNTFDERGGKREVHHFKAATLGRKSVANCLLSQSERTPGGAASGAMDTAGKFGGVPVGLGGAGEVSRLGPRGQLPKLT